MTNLEKIEEKYQLTVQAYNEVIEFILEATISSDYMDRHYFLEAWNQGDWCAIQNDWPEFNLNSEAQQHVINESGGMPQR
jgi:hypothetical protein